MGSAAIADEERRSYATKFVKACREKNLHAVAITDHHDLAFYPYIRDAAASELDDAGQPIPADTQLIVFPGVELTLSLPCQALVIFDANLPPTLISSILLNLGITPAPDVQQYGVQPVQVAHLQTLKAVYERLNANPNLKGRFIVLPHVQDGGHGTILRSGFATHYKEMPCVGGYLDGSIEKLGEGNRKILAGEDSNYGNKPLGVFQTSDCRREDFETLGLNSTWVKWATPTAEALRQACLSRHSRISQTEPRYPTISIRGIEVTNSAFLGSTKLELNPQFNAFIGGRGTGKSTLLEYIRWALCDQPAVVKDEISGDVPNYAIKRELLIRGTLEDRGGVVTVICDLNGVPHTVRRDSRTGSCQLRIGSGKFTDVPEKEIREKIPIQAYSQKQLSSVAVLPNEIQRLVTAEIQEDTDTITSQLRLLADDIREADALEARKGNLEAEIAKDRAQIESLKAQIDNLRKGLKGLSEEDQRILSEQPVYAEEEAVLFSLERNIGVIGHVLAEAKSQVENLSLAHSLKDLPDAVRLNELLQEFNQTITKVATALTQLHTSLIKQDKRLSPAFEEKIEAIEASIGDFKVRYNAAKAKSSSHSSSLQELARLEKNLEALNQRVVDKVVVVSGLGNPSEALQAKWSQWKGLHLKRSQLITNQSQNLHTLSGGQFRARVKAFGDPKTIRTSLDVTFERKSIRKAEDKIDSLISTITNADDPYAKWEELIGEFAQLFSYQGTTKLPSSPLLENAGLTRENRESLRDGMTREVLLNLRLTILRDLPIFEFKAAGESYIGFNEASSGQQATALLKILLNQDGPPLLIDQPEEDLDNEVIQEIATNIWVTKAKRQLIFVSHNANIVVNGDAELIVWFDYLTPEDPSQGHIKQSGAIDIPEIRECIKKIMEGGEEAFELRRQKYGF